MGNTQIIIETLVSGLANLKSIQDDLIIELNEFEDAYSKEAKIVNDRLDNISVQIDSTIKEAIKQIQFPKGISEEEIISLIKAETDKINFDTSDIENQTTKQLGQLKSELLQTISEIEIPAYEIPTSESINYDKIQDTISSWIENNSDLFKSEFDSTQLKKELQAFLANKVSNIPKAKDGQDGIGIKDIERVKDDLVITLTDGTEKRIKLPKPQIIHQGGGGGQNIENFSYDLVDKIVTIPYNQQMIVMGGIDIESELHLDGRLFLEI
jgi:hypothetical protein